MVWYASIPFLSLLLSGNGAALVWTSVSILTVAAMSLASEVGFHFPCEVSPAGMRFCISAG